MGLGLYEGAKSIFFSVVCPKVRYRHQEGSTIYRSRKMSFFDVAPCTTRGGKATMWLLHLAINKEV